METKFAIKTKDLTKKYGDLTSVDKLNLEIAYGEVFGLLGPNGAGKTTAISMLCTIINPSSGSAIVNGFNVLRQPADVRRSIGIVFQDLPYAVLAEGIKSGLIRPQGDRVSQHCGFDCSLRPVDLPVQRWN